MSGKTVRTSVLATLAALAVFAGTFLYLQICDVKATEQLAAVASTALGTSEGGENAAAEAKGENGNRAPRDPTPSDATQNVGSLLQEPVLPWGCESFALANTLHGFGYDVDGTEIYDYYLEHSDDDFIHAYAGNAYEMWGYGLAMPPALVDAANRFLRENDAPERAHNITRVSFDRLLELVDLGYPVMVWTTIDLWSPIFYDMDNYGEGPQEPNRNVRPRSGESEGDGEDAGDNAGEDAGANRPDNASGTSSDDAPSASDEKPRESHNKYAYYDNEHCVVLYGYDEDTVYVSDSLYGLVEHDIDEFRSIYDQCGRMAIVIF